MSDVIISEKSRPSIYRPPTTLTYTTTVLRADSKTITAGVRPYTFVTNRLLFWFVTGKFWRAGSQPNAGAVTPRSMVPSVI